jgi:hypothetical protein
VPPRASRFNIRTLGRNHPLFARFEVGDADLRPRKARIFQLLNGFSRAGIVAEKAGDRAVCSSTPDIPKFRSRFSELIISPILRLFLL